jgi:hypothetical protein
MVLLVRETGKFSRGKPQDAVRLLKGRTLGTNPYELNRS